MARLSFNRVFFGLMMLSFISAFLAPQHLTDAGRGQFEGLFVPVSKPAYTAANWLRLKLAPDPPDDTRSAQTLIQENLQLRQQIARQQMLIERLESLAGEKQNLGDLKSLCDRVPVGGTDSGSREGLILSGGSLGSLKKEQPVVYGGGLVGKIDRAGLGAAHVLLITDAGLNVTGRIIRFVKTDAGVEAKTISNTPVVVRGAGDGHMTITNLAYADASSEGVKMDDWIILADNTWPTALQGIRVGRISAIEHWKRQPLFAEIRLEPQSSLISLPDVWVMTRQP